jgi:hypothetical protein
LKRESRQKGNLSPTPALLCSDTRKQERIMDSTTLIILIIVLFFLIGGGWYGRGRWY